MAASIPTTEPTVINAGDTIKWVKTLPDYSAADGWALSYTLVNASGQYTAAASASGADHAVTISATTSATYQPGVYDWRARASKAGEVFTVASGQITVKPTFASATDARSQARRTLQAIEDTLEGRASSATAEYEIAGRKLKYIPLPELLTLRDRYRADVARENIAAGLGAGGRIQVRFQA